VTKTYSVEQAVEIIGAPSERWLTEHLRSGRFPGRKVGRHWQVTDQDIAAILDLCRNNHCGNASQSMPLGIGLTPKSKRRVAKLRLVPEPPLA
jgi:hypothetical protein